MARRIGVICNSCGSAIEIEDEYVSGISGSETVARFYRPVGKMTLDFANRAWPKTLICRNPKCGQLHKYTAGDLRLYAD
jgi:hypothetical protein